MIFLLGFGTVLTVWNFVFFILLDIKSVCVGFYCCVYGRWECCDLSLLYLCACPKPEPR